MNRASSYLPLVGLVVLMLSVRTQAATHQVRTYSDAATQLGQAVTSSTLVWETYDARDSKQLQSAVEGGKYITEEEHYPIYVCRVIIDGVPTSGHTEKIQQSYVCVAANSRQSKFKAFDVLVNKGHLGKVSWMPWRKFNAGIPVGAIQIGDETYLARHRAAPHKKPGQEQEEHWGADYNLGRLDPSLGLGKIKVIENELDKDYDEGDVLIETEPVHYELHDIKLDNIRLDIRENITDLASGVLVNHGDAYSLVESVMTYEFDYMQNWGTHEGLARGLPTKIFEKDASTPTEVNWALKLSEKRSETKSVHTKLWPGTALNVTLKGNYVTLIAPYTAKLTVFYRGSQDSVSRKISSEVKKNYLKDVKLDFSPVYWIENGTIVPTTTTTTTSTTSTTTHATTTSTGEPAPMHEPPVVQLKPVGEQHSGPDSLEQALNDHNKSNEINDGPENFKHQTTVNTASIGGGSGSSSNNGQSSSSSLSRSAAVACVAFWLMMAVAVGGVDAVGRR